MTTFVFLMACSSRDADRPPTLPPEPPPTQASECRVAAIYAGDYFWRGGLPEYPAWFQGVRVFWRPDVPIRAFICGISGPCFPVRYVIYHNYGGCDQRDTSCGLAVLERLAQAGVRDVEIHNEQGAECGSCLAAQWPVLRRAKELGMRVWVNIEPWPSPEWVEAADRVALHGREPQDVDGIPDWLWLSGKLELSTDAQHCETPPGGCQHVDSMELLQAIIERLRRQPSVVTFEADFFDNGRIGGHLGWQNDWIDAEWPEFRSFVEGGCR